VVASNHLAVELHLLAGMGAVALGAGALVRAPWRLIFLIGSCLAAPIGLHFSLALIGRADAWRAWIGLQRECGYGACTRTSARAAAEFPAGSLPV